MDLRAENKAPLVCVVVLFGSSLGCAAHGESDPADTPPRAVEIIASVPKPQPSAPSCLRAGPVTPLGLKPSAGALGDLDGDGQPDVLALAHLNGASALVVLKGKADGTFEEGAPIPTDETGLALGDLDGDGDLDALLLSGRSRPRYRVAQNDGRGSFTLGPSTRIPGKFGGELRMAALGDLDRDGDLDAVVPLWDSLRVLKNRGDGRFRASQRLRVGRDPLMSVLADLDDDGYLDLATASGAAIESDPNLYRASGAAVWFHRGGSGGFSRSAVHRKFSEASGIAVADLDSDGVSEIAVTRTWGVTVVRDPRFWADDAGWGQPPQGEGSPWVPSAAPTQLEMGTDGRLLVANLGMGHGASIIAPSYMQGRLNIANGPTMDEMTAFEAGSFVVRIFSADVGRDQTLPDIVLLNAGPPGPPYGAPAPSISVVFVDCA